MKQRAPDLTDSRLLDQLCDAVISKLTQSQIQHLTFNQGVVGSNPSRPTIGNNITLLQLQIVLFPLKAFRSLN